MDSGKRLLLVDDEAYMARLSNQVQENYRNAFISQTGLQPDQVVMTYGQEIVEYHGHLMKRFSVRFLPKCHADEISKALAEIHELEVKNCALAMVLTVLAKNAGLGEQEVVELLQAAEFEYLKTPESESTPVNEVPGFVRDPAL